MTTGFVKSRRATVNLPGYVIAAFTANADEITLATGPSAPLAGVVDRLGGRAGTLTDIYLTEIAEVRAGGVIAPGDRLTADAQGRAVKAVKLANATVFTVGVAQEPAVENDIIGVLIAPGAIDA